MYCANCGTEHESDAKFCRSCGQTFTAVSQGGDLALEVGGRLGDMLQRMPTDLTHERMGAIISQAAGLLCILFAALAVATKPSPGIFMLYALPSLLGGVVTVLERRSSVGKAVLLLLMLTPYFLLFLVGVPPIFTSGLRDINAVAAGLGGYMTLVGFSAFFLMLSFLLLVLTPIATLILQRMPALAGLSALAASLAFSFIIMLMLGMPSSAVARSITVEEQLDERVKIHTTATLPHDDGSLESTAAFMSNELIYPYVEGLNAGASFGFRLVDDVGHALVAFDRGEAIRATGSGLEKAVALNTVDARVTPGSYTLELLVTQGWHTMLLSRTPVTIRDGINPNYGADAGSTFAWMGDKDGATVTAYAAGDPIYLVLDGSRVQDEVMLLIKDSADKIVFDKRYTAMPLGKSSYELAAKASQLGTGQFIASLSTAGKDPVTIYFTID